MKTYNMPEEIKQKDKLKDGFEDLVINDTGKNFDDDMFIIQDWWLKQFDSLLSQALQKRDEAIIGAIRTTFPSFDDNPNWGENEKTILKTTDYVVKGVIDLINAK